MRPILSFLLAFAVGALIALAVRASLHQPHAAHEPEGVAGGDYKPMVGNTLAPAPAEAKAAGASSHTHSPAAGAPAAAPAPKPDPAADAAHHHVPASTKPVNTLCAICGMDVDPDLPTATYQGQTIGFGCPACPPKFRANPDRYGPAYLRNERAK